MTDPRDLPLSGMRVLDLADGLGDLCGRLFADLGADVVRAYGGSVKLAALVPGHSSSKVNFLNVDL